MSAQTVPSAALLAANERLKQLRATQLTIRQASQWGGPPAGQDSRPLLNMAPQGHLEPAVLSEMLPAHLGWGSAALTAVLRRQAQWAATGNAPAIITVFGRSNRAVDDNVVGHTCHDSQPDDLASTRQTHAKTPSHHNWVKLYPDIGLAMLRQEMSAPGRLWLILHHLDPKGRGVLRIDIIRQTITTRNTKLYLCGKRQLRNLLRDGEGVFWTRDKTHVWLRSAGRVAQALGVARLTGRPVAIPASALLEGIGAFRAQLYAAFHSGRVRPDNGAAKSVSPRRAMPISRDTLTNLSGVGRSSQRVYEARLQLWPEVNYAIGEAIEKTKEEERAWHQGQALFGLKDYRGEQGKQGKSYLAWQLPNSYRGQHQQRPKGRQKRINRQLRDLVMKGMPGNVGMEEEALGPEKRYYPNGRSAGQARGPKVAEERYWRRQRPENGRFALWHPVKGG